MNKPLDTRQEQLLCWLYDRYSTQNITLTPVSGDASFRRYFRFCINNESSVAVDSPPDRENNQPFIDITQLLISNGICVPQIKHQSLTAGFFVISDFGDRLLLNELASDNANMLYQLAFDTLLQIQQTGTESIPPYDSALLQREMSLFTDWYLRKHKQIAFDNEIEKLLTTTYSLLEQSALDQPTVFVHRDYHSRNLMLLPDNKLGIIDYQDAVKGPITYDLVSLLRDCYISWPQEKIDQWVKQFYSQLSNNHDFNLQQFQHYFDLMGVQRHLKAIGIFCRLKYRDDKHTYVDDIPRTLDYVMQISAKHDELKPFHSFLQSVH